MSLRAHELARQRDALIDRCEAQRRRMAELAQPLKSASRVFDRALAVARYVRAHPLLAAAALAALAMVSPAGWLRRLGLVLPIVSAGLRAWPSRRSLGSPPPGDDRAA
jgi:hypothetical protein